MSLENTFQGTNIDGVEITVDMDEVSQQVRMAMGEKGGVLRVGDIGGPLWIFDSDTNARIALELVEKYDCCPVKGQDLAGLEHVEYLVLEYKKGSSQDFQEAELLRNQLSSYV